jgi:predicted MFS family arabinose efflux permease
VLGGWTAQYPLELLISYLSWRSAFDIAFVGLLILMILLYTLLRNLSTRLEKPFDSQKIWRDISKRWSVFFMMLFICLSMILPILIIPEMWGSYFLETAYHVSSIEASAILSFFFIGIACGNLSLGIIAHLCRRSHVIVIAIICEILFCTLFIYGGDLMTPSILSLLACGIGFSASTLLLFFDMINTRFEEPRLGLPAINIFITLLSSSFHPLIGWYLDSYIHEQSDASAALYQSFLVIPLFLCCGLIMILRHHSKHGSKDF